MYLLNYVIIYVYHIHLYMIFGQRKLQYVNGYNQSIANIDFWVPKIFELN